MLFSLPSQIEGLLDDIDFKAKVTRQEFEDLCSDLFQRVAGPVQQALSSAEIGLVGALGLLVQTLMVLPQGCVNTRGPT